MSDALIQLIGINKAYKAGSVMTPVLHEVYLSIQKGEFVAIMGPSGSGKSTLMNIMGLLDRASFGSYELAGRDTATYSDEGLARLRARTIGFVFQAFHLLPRASSVENVMLPMMYAHIPAKEREGRARKALEEVGLAHRLHHDSSQLSGGEKQRVAIARALANEPSLILADEPTGNLDSASSGEVLRLLKRLHEQGHTIVMITHEMEAARYAKRVVTLHDGRIASDVSKI